MHVRLLPSLRKPLPPSDDHTMHLSPGTTHLRKGHTGFPASVTASPPLTLTISAVAVAMPLMRCMKLRAMRSATRIDSALPRTTPNRVPAVTAVPSDAVHVTWTERGFERTLTERGPQGLTGGQSIMAQALHRLALFRAGISNRSARRASPCKQIARGLVALVSDTSAVGTVWNCHVTSVALHRKLQRDVQSPCIAGHSGRCSRLALEAIAGCGECPMCLHALQGWWLVHTLIADAIVHKCHNKPGLRKRNCASS